ncbi:GNAT family N-acetyltransferase [Roseobacter sp. YSTF-M11]|uniref:GNAT family N-acetyltransferase n=1 Tax=Roseobacter insulae TaxID=2859783 RepID=A0A9X1K251_9RHOB|nr:GNAT family N-acetyltransferase [Roseobacter insulae]MBW4707172.1 GNAT family N-acetyltransferase [Roseobacter insulae]
MATLADAGPLAACIDQAYAHYEETIPDLPDVSAGIEEDISRNSVWVATKSGLVVGGAIVIVQNPDAVLTNIAVAPVARGTGLGRALMARVEDDCRRLGVHRLTLSTHVLMPRNIALYQHLGWQESGRDGNKVRMEKRLVSH